MLCNGGHSLHVLSDRTALSCASLSLHVLSDRTALSCASHSLHVLSDRQQDCPKLCCAVLVTISMFCLTGNRPAHQPGHPGAALQRDAVGRTATAGHQRRAPAARVKAGPQREGPRARTGARSRSQREPLCLLHLDLK